MWQSAAGPHRMYVECLILTRGIAVGHRGTDITLRRGVEHLPVTGGVGTVTIGSWNIESPLSAVVWSGTAGKHRYADRGVTCHRACQEEQIVVIGPKRSGTEYRGVLVGRDSHSQAAQVYRSTSGTEHNLLRIECPVGAASLSARASRATNGNRSDRRRVLRVLSCREPAERPNEDGFQIGHSHSSNAAIVLLVPFLETVYIASPVALTLRRPGTIFSCSCAHLADPHSSRSRLLFE
jgi:hypothetical protein